MAESPHIPVMLEEVLTSLAPARGEVYVDGTFGAGGYSRAFLEAGDCTVVAIDRDPQALARAGEFAAEFSERFIFQRGRFGEAEALVHEAGFEKVDGFVLDIGVSSMQIDEAERGFSFRADGPLDMRMDPEGGGPDASEIVNSYDEKQLADIIYHFGEERRSRRVARAIVEARKNGPITRTNQLAEIIRSVVPFSPKDKIDPATRTFQALRIEVNKELDELEKALSAAERLLKSGGRLIVVSFHSLEDSIVKKFLKNRSGRKASPSRYVPEAPASDPDPTFTLPSVKAVIPSAAESAANPRSRSAKMRVAIRTDAPAWPSSFNRRGAG